MCACWRKVGSHRLREEPMNRIPSPNDDPLREPMHEPLQAGLVGASLHSEMLGNLQVDPDRERRHQGGAAIDPFDISDIMAKYAPTRGSGSVEQWAKEIDFNW